MQLLLEDVHDDEGVASAYWAAQSTTRGSTYLASSQAMFRAADGTDHGELWVDGEIPVFVNEAAYAEKSIAFSFTRREVWPVEETWLPALQQLLCAAQPQAQTPLPS